MSLTKRIASKSLQRTPSIASCVRHNLRVVTCLSGRPFGCLHPRALHGAPAGKSNASPKQASNHAIHSSASNPKSAGAASVHILDSPKFDGPSAPLPTYNQLRTLFVSSAIPMVGFGFMDNFVMIQAGSYIDSTIGVQFGLATLTAAAMGQVVSDVSGVVFGGTLERFLERMKLIKPSNLTTAQRQLPVARNTAMAGAVVGVIVGCLLGASSLMFVDLEAHDRQNRALELVGMLTSILAEEDEASMGCERCVVYLRSSDHIPLGYQYVEDQNVQKPQIKLLEEAGNNSLVAKCEESKVVCMDNHGGSTDFGMTKSQLCAPVLSDDGEVIAVLEFRNKHAKRGSKFVDTTFSDDDERTARILSRHIAIFMNRLASH